MKLYTLTDVAEIMAGEHKKGFANHLFHARLIWNDLLRNTLWAYSSKWLNTNKGNPYPYVTIPSNTDTFYALYEEDNCGKLVAVPYTDGRYVITKKPSQKTCGCKKDCDCGECCAAASTTTYATKAHNIDGATYYEKIWTEVCAGGDIVQYREVPSKDFSGGSFSIVYHKDQRRLCTVEVKECGCVEDTPANAILLAEYCGCSVTCNSTHYGPLTGCSTKMQVEGTKIYLIGGTVKENYLMHFVEKDACDTSLVPEYALRCLVTGVDWSKEQFAGLNPNLASVKEGVYKRMKFDLLKDLNKIDTEFLAQLGNEPSKW